MSCDFPLIQARICVWCVCVRSHSDKWASDGREDKQNILLFNLIFSCAYISVVDGEIIWWWDAETSDIAVNNGSVSTPTDANKSTQKEKGNHNGKYPQWFALMKVHSQYAACRKQHKLVLCYYAHEIRGNRIRFFLLAIRFKWILHAIDLFFLSKRVMCQNTPIHINSILNYSRTIFLIYHRLRCGAQK